MPVANSILDRLDEPYPLDASTIDAFRRDGFVRLPGVFDAEVLDACAEVVTRITVERNPQAGVPMEERDTYGRAFIQVMNLWRDDEVARRFTFSKRLARIATELLEVGGVRLWHDQALYKEPGGGFTPWHVDQQYWPMLTDRAVTVWIPLQPVPMDMGPLCFGRGSHAMTIARGMEISDASEQLIADAVEQYEIEQIYEPFASGDVSFHMGWTLHRAGPNTTSAPRKVHTIIYMDREQRLIEPQSDAHRNDHAAWTPGTTVGAVMADELNPVLYEVG